MTQPAQFGDITDWIALGGNISKKPADIVSLSGHMLTWGTGPINLTSNNEGKIVWLGGEAFAFVDGTITANPATPITHRYDVDAEFRFEVIPGIPAITAYGSAVFKGKFYVDENVFRGTLKGELTFVISPI